MATPNKKQTKKAQHHRSFQRGQSQNPFFTFRFTQQTLYWLILCSLVLALGIWVMYLTLKVERIYDDIDQAVMDNSYVMPTSKDR